jgi:serine/threonine protein kinase
MSSGEDILLNELSLIGFDHAFEISSLKTIEPLTEFLVPEVAVGKPASPASDVWALGVTILNIRSGISLFPWPEYFITE